MAVQVSQYEHLCYNKLQMVIIIICAFRMPEGEIESDEDTPPEPERRPPPIGILAYADEDEDEQPAGAIEEASTNMDKIQLKMERVMQSISLRAGKCEEIHTISLTT